MSVTPGRYNFTLQRRADFDLQLGFRDSAGIAIDLTDWSVYAQAWDRGRTVKYSDFTVTYTDRINGIMHISLTDVQTETMPDECFYDVMLESPSGLREYYLEGMIIVYEGYTKPAA
jgi:hypothetical protein